MSTPPPNNQTTLAEGLVALLGQFASAMKTIDNSVPVQTGKKYVLAGDELSAKNTEGFLQTMGIPETAPEENTLLRFAKLTATPSEGEFVTLAEIPGPTSEMLSAIAQLKTLLDNGLASMSNRKKKILRTNSSAVVKQIIHLLEGDKFAIKLVHNLAAMGVLTGASWLLWSSKEKGWKIGSWGVLVMGFIRLLGNLLYNKYDVVKQTWNMAYVHVGLGAVGYALEIAKRVGYTPEQNTPTTLRNFCLTLIPVGAFYFKDLWNAGQSFFYKREHKHSGGASAEDVNLLQPILNVFQTYHNTSKDALGDNSSNKPGNRTKKVALNLQAGVQQLFAHLKLDVDPDTQRTWKETFKFLAYRAAINAPSILYALFTGIFLLVAAQNDPQALSDATVLGLILTIELVLGIGNEKTPPEELAYQMILLTLGRFFSIFFYAAPKIHHLINTGSITNRFNEDPQLAAELAHISAFILCTFGLAVIPTFKLFVTGCKLAFKKAARARQQEHSMELESQAPAASSEYPVTEALLGNLWEDEDDNLDNYVDSDGDEGEIPNLLTWDEDFDEDEVDEEELARWETVMKDLTGKCIVEMTEEVNKFKQKPEGENTGFFSMMASMGGFGFSSETAWEMIEILDQNL